MEVVVQIVHLLTHDRSGRSIEIIIALRRGMILGLLGHWFLELDKIIHNYSLYSWLNG